MILRGVEGLKALLRMTKGLLGVEPKARLSPILSWLPAISLNTTIPLFELPSTEPIFYRNLCTHNSSRKSCKKVLRLVWLIN